MSINTQLSDLQSNLQTAKDSFATILTNKGITTVNQYSPLQDMIDSVDTIQTGGSCIFNFGEIGYVGTEEPLASIYNYSKNIYDTWDPLQTNLFEKYNNNTQLVYMPLVDTTNATNMRFMFSGCSNLQTVPQLNTINVTDLSVMFRSCAALKTIPTINTSNATTVRGMFIGCSLITTIPLINTSKATNLSHIFTSCSLLTYVPELDFSSATTIWPFGNPPLTYMVVKNLGKSSSTTYNLSQLASWGTGVSTNRQSLIDSLITYSYDRAANSMETATIQLSTTTKALLTANEIAAINAKGFTIA